MAFFFWFLFFLAGFLLAVPFGLSEVSQMSPFFRACYETVTEINSHVMEKYTVTKPPLPYMTVATIRWSQGPIA